MDKWQRRVWTGVVVALAATGMSCQKGSDADLKVEKYFVASYIPEYTPLSGGFFPGSMENPSYEILRPDRYVVVVVSMPYRKLRELGYDEVDAWEAQPRRRNGAAPVAAADEPIEMEYDPELDGPLVDVEPLPEEPEPVETPKSDREQMYEAIEEGLGEQARDVFEQAGGDWVPAGPEDMAGYEPGRRYPDFTLICADEKTVKPRRVAAWPDPKARGPAEFQDWQQWYPQPGTPMDKRFYLAISFHTNKDRATGPFQLQLNDEEPITVSEDASDFYFKWDDF